MQKRLTIPTRDCTMRDIQAFVNRAQAVFPYGTLRIRKGSRYYRIVYDNDRTYAFISPHGFIHVGDKHPKRHARGNIFSERGGLEALDSNGFIYKLHP